MIRKLWFDPNIVLGNQAQTLNECSLCIAQYLQDLSRCEPSVTTDNSKVAKELIKIVETIVESVNPHLAGLLDVSLVKLPKGGHDIEVKLSRLHMNLVQSSPGSYNSKH